LVPVRHVVDRPAVVRTVLYAQRKVAIRAELHDLAVRRIRVRGRRGGWCRRAGRGRATTNTTVIGLALIRRCAREPEARRVAVFEASLAVIAEADAAFLWQKEMRTVTVRNPLAKLAAPTRTVSGQLVPLRFAWHFVGLS
jgi:hypothetical protein